METQIDRAMIQASLLRLTASHMKQMGFKVLADYYLDQAKKAERFAAKKGGE